MKTSRVWALALTALFVVEAKASEPIGPTEENSELVIPAGTEIPLIVEKAISSKVYSKGDLFYLKTTKDLKIDGRTAILAGTKVVAELTRAEKKGAFGKSGKLEAKLLYAALDNQTIRLQGVVAARGKGGTTETVLAAMAIGTLAFFVTGRSAEIPAGTELSGYLSSDARIR